ncbi:MAG: M1 family aminopeptidase [Flavobacteriales bacterium]
MHTPFPTPAALLFCLIHPGLHLHAQTSTAALPPLHAPRIPGSDIQHIALDLRFDRQKRQAKGTASITLSPLSPADSIWLDAGALTIERVALGNGTALTYAYDGGDRDDGLRIALDRKYTAGEVLTLVIDYHSNHVNESDPNNLGGSNGKGLRYIAPTTTEPRKRKQLWSMAEHGSNRYWFPCYDGLGDPRSTELVAHVEDGLTVISNGELISDDGLDNGTHRVHWKMDRPYDNYQTFIVVGGYTLVEQASEGIKLHNYSYPDEVDATHASVERLPDMMAYYSDVTGVPYPARTYTQVFVQDLPWGMWGFGAGVQSENMVDDFGTHADFFYLWDGLEADALAQQWFTGAIQCPDWSEAWLGRGFARYMSERYSVHRNGRDEYLLWNHLFDLGTCIGDWSNGIRHPLVTQQYDDALAFISDNTTTIRGALVLHMLRGEIGEAAFDVGLKIFVKANTGRAATTADLQRAMESAAGKPLSWFFDQWVHSMGHPVFEVTTAFDAAQGSYSIALRQTQQPDSTSAYPQTRFFQGNMTIAIDGEMHNVRVEPRELNTFFFPLVAEPRLVNVDHQGTWIKEVIFRKSAHAWVHHFTHDADVLGRQAAMGELAAIMQDSTTTTTTRNSILSAFHEVISDTSTYWRVRYNAITQLRWLIAPPFDAATVDLLKGAIDRERSWNRAAAIALLGLSNDPAYAGLYIDHLKDESDRVVNAAAIALGRSKSPLAFDALMHLKVKPSWKNQSLISTLYGLQALGDPRGAGIALDALKDANAAPRWTLATPVWDFRIAAAQTLVALGKGTDGWPIVEARYRASLAESDINDIFSNVLLIATLGDVRGRPVFAELRQRFKDDANAVTAVDTYEKQFLGTVE